MTKKIYYEEGLLGFFKGITPSLVLTLVPVLQFTSYEVIKVKLTNREGKISNKHILFASLISKLATILVSYPLMSLKALFQSSSKLSNDAVLRLILKLIKEQGILGLYKGFEPKVIGALINNFALMLTYERLQNLVRIMLAKLLFGKNHSIITI
jgi:solute carrier family 25 folate transporter 32